LNCAGCPENVTGGNRVAGAPRILARLPEPGDSYGFADQGAGLCNFLEAERSTPSFKRPSSLLLIRDGQEDAIIHGHRVREKSGAVRAHDGDVSGLAAHRRTGEL